MSIITIITPTYNRETYLGKLFNSLKEQTSKNFKWIIVDDGSTDNTKEVIIKFLEKQEREFEIQYIYKENGGKHTALNKAMEFVDTELVFIVDSDDYLPKNSIHIIEKYYEKFNDVKIQEKLCGYSFLRCHADGSVNTAYFPENEKIDSYCNVRINGNIGGDKAEVYYTDILKRYPFPVFEGECFLAEDVVWMQMSGPYNMVHINENIYICDYLEGGLTTTGRRMKIKSPRGMILRSKIYLDDSKVCFKVKIKMMLLYIIYSEFAGINIQEAFKNINEKKLFILLFIPGLLIQRIWNIQLKNN